MARACQPAALQSGRERGAGALLQPAWPGSTTIAPFGFARLRARGKGVRLLLAPMEGLLDDVLRAVITPDGGYDHAVTEFVRVSGTLLPARSFRRTAPELDHGSRTVGGTPLRVQLLGSDPACMADNATQLAGLSPAGVDLNFGCPAPTVNRHGGGAALLDEPERMHRIVAAVRAALPAALPLSAKMRLGTEDAGRAVEAAQALASGGIDLLVVHARTRADVYRPPARWEWVGRIAAEVSVPVIANGEVWTASDWLACRARAGVADVMLGRGAVADPFLAHRIRAGLLQQPDAGLRAAEWRVLQRMLAEFRRRALHKLPPRHVPGRIKQWLNLLRRNFVQAEQLHAAIRGLRELRDIDRVFATSGIALSTATDPQVDATVLPVVLSCAA